MTNSNNLSTAAENQTMVGKRKKTMKLLLPAVTLIPMLAGLIPHLAKAQVDPGTFTHTLYENGVQVGEAYVLDRAAGRTQYAEDWVLYPNYANAGPRFIGALQVVPSTEKRYMSESDFFNRVPFPAGSKFIRVSAEEFASLPIAR